jgi:alpha-tubulin suppressor-like RCC1 family protein
MGADTDWSRISAGNWHTTGIKRNGSLWTWGSNSYGRLGLGDIADRNSPAKVGQ